MPCCCACESAEPYRPSHRERDATQNVYLPLYQKNLLMKILLLQLFRSILTPFGISAGFRKFKIFQSRYYHIPKIILLYSKVNIIILLYSKTHLTRCQRRRMRHWVLQSGAVQKIFENAHFGQSSREFRKSLWSDPSKNSNRYRLRISALFSTRNRVN